MEKTYLTALRSVIESKYDCRACHRKTAFVEKAIQDRSVWQGHVETFDLIGHATAHVCYAWLYIDVAGKMKHVTVLASRVIDSPQKAISAAIFVDAMRPTVPAVVQEDQEDVLKQN